MGKRGVELDREKLARMFSFIGAGNQHRLGVFKPEEGDETYHGVIRAD